MVQIVALPCMAVFLVLLSRVLPLAPRRSHNLPGFLLVRGKQGIAAGMASRGLMWIAAEAPTGPSLGVGITRPANGWADDDFGDDISGFSLEPAE